MWPISSHSQAETLPRQTSIGQILVKENVKGTFSYFNFYNRRVKRIYPALIVVLLFVLYVGIRYSSK